MKTGKIAVIDVGKTNAKLALVDACSLEEGCVITRPNHVLPGPPWPHFDTQGQWEFFLEGLTRFQADHGVDAISVTTHGACVVLLDGDGNLAAPILDYEHKGPDELRADYEKIRPPFEETGSPSLSGGLNIGAQIFWQFQVDPHLKIHTRHILTYPQYWGFRLTGKMATDVTSLGCHTDLWNPYLGTYSPLVETLKLKKMLAPAKNPHDVLGALKPDICDQTGLNPHTPVYCGIHDSNASLLPHLISNQAPFSVVSTGTWVITMAIGGRQRKLNPEEDTLVNVSAFGDPVPSARFMGGREYDLLVQGPYVPPSEHDIDDVLSNRRMILPSYAPDSSPFKGQKGQWIGEEPDIGTGKRSVCVSFYLALMTNYCLNLIGADGPIHIEGPFAKNPLYLQMLHAVSRRPVKAMTSSTGTSQGAALLVTQATNSSKAYEPVRSHSLHSMNEYAVQWLKHVEARLTQQIG